jgi:hypothetical protein
MDVTTMRTCLENTVLAHGLKAVLSFYAIRMGLRGDLGDKVAVVVELVSAGAVAGVDQPQRVGPDVVVLSPAIEVDVGIRRAFGTSAAFFILNLVRHLWDIISRTDDL